MYSRQSESLLVLPLLPIFLLGTFPMLMFGLLGFAGLGLFGILLICVGLSDALEANSAFNEQIIVHGYARGSERTVQITRRHAATRFAAAVSATGAALVVAAACGFLYFG